MIAQESPGTTRFLGEKQGYIGLPVSDVQMRDQTTDEPFPAMETFWQPNPAELDALNKGALVKLVVLGSQHPPVIVTTSEPPEGA